MKDLLLPAVQSTYITLNRPFDNFSRDADLIGGWQNPRSAQRILLQFDLSLLGECVDIVCANLRLFANDAHNGFGLLTPYLIGSDWHEETVNWDTQPDYNPSISGATKIITSSGWHYWDVTDIAQRWTEGENYGVMLLADEREIADWKSFDHNCRFRPALLVKYDEFSDFMRVPDGSLCSFEVAHAGSERRFSCWQRTCACKVYDFFVKNLGPSPVCLSVQISPDECAEYDEAAQYHLEPGKTETIVPQRFAYFTRLAFAAGEPDGHAKIKIWFQAQT